VPRERVWQRESLQLHKEIIPVGTANSFFLLFLFQMVEVGATRMFSLVGTLSFHGRSCEPRLICGACMPRRFT
jgi:hypothetical protein